MERKEAAYILVEILIVISIFGLIISAVAAVNHSLQQSWDYINQNNKLQQELRIAMSVVAANLNDALAVIDIDDSSNRPQIKYLSGSGKSEKIYWQKGLGLCLNDNNNKISNRVNRLELKLIDDLLYVNLGVLAEKRDLTLQSIFKIN